MIMFRNNPLAGFLIAQAALLMAVFLASPVTAGHHGEMKAAKADIVEVAVSAGVRRLNDLHNARCALAHALGRAAAPFDPPAPRAARRRGPIGPALIAYLAGSTSTELTALSPAQACPRTVSFGSLRGTSTPLFG